MSTLRTTALPGGLVVASETMPEAASVSLGLWFGVGTRYEDPAEGGLSHLLEHMFFKGTVSRDARTLNRLIEDAGGSLNAYTSRERTAYTARVLAADLPLGIDLLADMMLRPRLDPMDLAKERTVIAQEIGEAYDAPDDWVFDLFHLTAYPGQGLGRPVLGTPATLECITPERLRDYIRTHYCAPRALLAAAGAVEHEALVALAGHWLADLPGGKSGVCEPARYQGGDALEGREIEQLHLCLGLEGVTATDPLFHAQNLFATALGGGTSSRLFHEVREEHALAYSVSAFPASYQDSCLFTIYAATDPGRARKASQLILRELTSLARSMSPEELDRAKALNRAGLLMDMESASARTERLAQHWQSYGQPRPLSETLALIDAVTLEQIAAFAAQLVRSPLTRAAVGPVKALPPFPQMVVELQS